VNGGDLHYRVLVFLASSLASAAIGVKVDVYEGLLGAPASSPSYSVDSRLMALTVENKRRVGIMLSGTY